MVCVYVKDPFVEDPKLGDSLKQIVGAFPIISDIVNVSHTGYSVAPSKEVWESWNIGKRKSIEVRKKTIKK